jgi:hypothetical protein
MPKPHTFPTLYNEALQIHISKLKEWNYLNLEQLKNGTITWSSNGEKIASISITVNCNCKEPYIELIYNSNNEPRRYKVRLISIPSNLDKGRIWYFLCPQTNKRCRKLYLVNGYFFHRNAFNGCMYACQTESKQWRRLKRTYDSLFEQDKFYEQMYSKHFKTHYKGKPTKRYIKLMKQISIAERISHEDIENLLIINKNSNESP